MKFILTSVVSFAVVLSTGCPRNLPDPDFSSGASKTYLINELRTNVFPIEAGKFDCSAVLRDYTVAGGVVTCGGPNTNPNGRDEAQRLRNGMLGRGVGIIDEVYMRYASAIAAGRSRENFLEDVAELAGGTAAGTIKGTARAINLIGVYLTAFKGGRKSADLNFYHEIPTTTLLHSMKAAREQVLGDIVTKQSYDPVRYDFDAALQDLIKYLYEGSLLVAVDRIDQDSAAKATAAEQRRKDLEGVFTAPIVSKELADIEQQVKTELDDLDSDCTVSTDPTTNQRSLDRYTRIITDLLKTPDFSSAVAQAVVDPLSPGNPSAAANLKSGAPETCQNLDRLLTSIHRFLPDDPAQLKLFKDVIVKNK